MLQQKFPNDYVISTGIQYSIRQFIQWTAEILNIELEFSGSSLNEIAVVKKFNKDKAPALKIGQVIVRVNKKYFRPTEVDSLLGNSSKAKNELGWEPKYTAKQVCEEMIESDLKEAKQIALINEHKLNN